MNQYFSFSGTEEWTQGSTHAKHALPLSYTPSNMDQYFSSWYSIFPDAIFPSLFPNTLEILNYAQHMASLHFQSRILTCFNVPIQEILFIKGHNL